MRRLKSSDCEDSLVCEVIERSNPWRVGANKRSRIVVNLGISQSQSPSVLVANWRLEFPRDSWQKTAQGRWSLGWSLLKGAWRETDGVTTENWPMITCVLVCSFEGAVNRYHDVRVFVYVS